MICSTIIPTVNRPSLGRAVASALDQALDADRHEIIVVNDSGRPLPDVEWLESRHIVILNTNRCERSVACNAGAAAATGRYLKILHDDDHLLPGALNALIDAAEASRGDWVYGAFDRIDDDGVLMSVQHPEVRGNVFAHSMVGDSFHLSASLIRRETFFRVGGFDPLMYASEDLDLQWRVSRIGKIDFTEHVVAAIRVGRSGLSSTDWSRKTDECRTIRDRVLDSPGAFRRICDSIGNDVCLRGRCCRAYLVSAALYLRRGHVCPAGRRLWHVPWLAGLSIIKPAFWRGLTMRSHWHRSEKAREEAHYAARHAGRFKPQSR